MTLEFSEIRVVLGMSESGNITMDVIDEHHPHGLPECDTQVPFERLRLPGDSIYQSTMDQINPVRELIADVLLSDFVTRSSKELVARHGNDPRWRLRIRLVLKSPSLDRVPWELVLEQVDGRLSLTRDRVSVVRSIPGNGAADSIEIAGSRLSIVYAGATNVRGCPLGSQVDLESFEALETERDVDATLLPDATLSEIKMALGTRLPDLVHVTAHGASDGAGIVLTRKDLKKQAAEAEEVLSPDRLAGVLAGVKVVVLLSCRSARWNSADQVSTAHHLVKSDVPAVIAMQDDIEEKLAARFSEAFYKELFDTLSLEAAVISGRKAIESNSNLTTSCVPVLYSGAGKPQLQFRKGRGLRTRHTAEPLSTEERAAFPKLRDTVNGANALWAVHGRGDVVELLEVAGEILSTRVVGANERTPRSLGAPTEGHMIEDLALSPRGDWLAVQTEGDVLVARNCRQREWLPRCTRPADAALSGIYDGERDGGAPELVFETRDGALTRQLRADQWLDSGGSGRELQGASLEAPWRLRDADSAVQGALLAWAGLDPESEHVLRVGRWLLGTQPEARTLVLPKALTCVRVARGKRLQVATQVDSELFVWAWEELVNSSWCES